MVSLGYPSPSNGRPQVNLYFLRKIAMATLSKLSFLAILFILSASIVLNLVALLGLPSNNTYPRRAGMPLPCLQIQYSLPMFCQTLPWPVERYENQNCSPVTVTMLETNGSQ